jgi:hypothetical protein
MLYLMARHELADFDKWNRIFRSHAEAQRRAGLHLIHVLRDIDDPQRVVALFSVDDLARAQAFTGAPGAHRAGGIAGVISVEMSYWTD